MSNDIRGNGVEKFAERHSVDSMIEYVLQTTTCVSAGQLSYASFDCEVFCGWRWVHVCIGHSSSLEMLPPCCITHICERIVPQLHSVSLSLQSNRIYSTDHAPIHSSPCVNGKRRCGHDPSTSSQPAAEAGRDNLPHTLPTPCRNALAADYAVCIVWGTLKTKTGEPWQYRSEEVTVFRKYIL